MALYGTPNTNYGEKLANHVTIASLSGIHSKRCKAHVRKDFGEELREVAEDALHLRGDNRTEKNLDLLKSLEVLITVILRQKCWISIVPIREKDGITY